MICYYLSSYPNQVTINRQMHTKVSKDALQSLHKISGYIVAEYKDILSIENNGTHLYKVQIEESDILDSSKMHKVHIVSNMFVLEYLGELKDLKTALIMDNVNCSIKDGLEAILDAVKTKKEASEEINIKNFQYLWELTIYHHYTEPGYEYIYSYNSINYIAKIFICICNHNMLEHIEYLKYYITTNFKDADIKEILRLIAQSHNDHNYNTIKFIINMINEERYRIGSSSTHVYAYERLLYSALVNGYDEFLEIFENVLRPKDIADTCKIAKEHITSHKCIDFMVKHGVEFSKFGNAGITNVVNQNNLELVKKLVDVGFKPTAYHSLMYKSALKLNYTEIANFLEPLS